MVRVMTACSLQFNAIYTCRRVLKVYYIGSRQRVSSFVQFIVHAVKKPSGTRTLFSNPKNCMKAIPDDEIAAAQPGQPPSTCVH